MTRNNTSARTAGQKFEQLIATHLARITGLPVERRSKNGVKDRGDLTGVTTIRGASVVVECKNVARLALGEWVAEAERERFHADADLGVVIHKRHGRGEPGEQYVTMTVDTFASMLAGGARPTHVAVTDPMTIFAGGGTSVTPPQGIARIGVTR
jgi:flavin reductase (DIM6/NTAB) family NADH-FMN oxidoreductase RutF